MSFNRLQYDDCAYATELKQSVSPLEYQLYIGKYENSKPCACNESDKTCNVDFTTRTDVENELYNLNRSSTLCPSKKFNPKANNFTNTYTPPTLCENIYHMTPSGLTKPTSNGLNNDNLTVSK